MTSPDDDDPMTLKEACEVVFKNAISPATLRAEVARGRLVIERIGRRDFVTRAAIKRMRELCEVGPRSTPHPNDHWTEDQRVAAAQAALMTTVDGLKAMGRKKKPQP